MYKEKQQMHQCDPVVSPLEIELQIKSKYTPHKTLAANMPHSKLRCETNTSTPAHLHGVDGSLCCGSSERSSHEPLVGLDLPWFARQQLLILMRQSDDEAQNENYSGSTSNSGNGTLASVVVSLTFTL